jgi:Subtilase family
VVKFDPSLSTAQIDDVLEREGLSHIRAIGRDGTSLLRSQPGRELEIIDRLLALPIVQYAEPDYVAHATLIPTDPLYAPYQGGPGDLGVMGMPAACDVTLGSSSTVVAALDTGLALAHPDLVGQWSYAPGQTSDRHVFLSGPSASCPALPIPATPDDDGWRAPSAPFTHGTHVSGTIAAQMNNGAGVAGMAPAARILPLKVLDCTGSGGFSDIATAITFAADNGASIVNMSLGANLSSCPTSTQNAINYAFGRGVMVVAAAGNSSDASVSYPAGARTSSASARRTTTTSSRPFPNIRLLPQMELMSARPVCRSRARTAMQLAFTATPSPAVHRWLPPRRRVRGSCAVRQSCARTRRSPVGARGHRRRPRDRGMGRIVWPRAGELRSRGSPGGWIADCNAHPFQSADRDYRALHVNPDAHAYPDCHADLVIPNRHRRSAGT